MQEESRFRTALRYNRGVPLLSQAQWQAQRAAHQARAREHTTPIRARLSRGETHPVADFLVRYYRFSLGRLEQWHPSWKTALEVEAGTAPLFPVRFYRRQGAVVRMDPSLLSGKEEARLRWTANLLRLTQSRAPQFSCHGLHEWAMVYRGWNVRHGDTTPLRLPQEEIDALVASRPLCCTHFDAFRFFTPEAQPLNKAQPGLWTREEHEQPGCLHANMDLYKWAYKSMPWIGSDLLWECFLFALRAREIDMRASPYDLSAFGYAPIAVETPPGRRQYEEEQRALAEAAHPLRRRLIESLDNLLSTLQNFSPTPTLTAQAHS